MPDPEPKTDEKVEDAPKETAPDGFLTLGGKTYATKEEVEADLARLSEVEALNSKITSLTEYHELGKKVALQGINDPEAFKEFYKRSASLSDEDAQKVLDYYRNQGGGTSTDDDLEYEDEEDDVTPTSVVPPRKLSLSDFDDESQKHLAAALRGAKKSTDLTRRHNEVQINNILLTDPVIKDFYARMDVTQQNYVLDDVARLGVQSKMDLEVLSPSDVERVRQSVRSYLTNTYKSPEMISVLNKKRDTTVGGPAGLLGSESPVIAGFRQEELENVDTSKLIPFDGTDESNRALLKQLHAIGVKQDKALKGIGRN